MNNNTTMSYQDIIAGCAAMKGSVINEMQWIQQEQRFDGNQREILLTSCQDHLVILDEEISMFQCFAEGQ